METHHPVPPEAQRAASVAPHPVIARYYASRDEQPAFVRGLFDRSAGAYDRIDAFASLGTGRWYRHKALLEGGLSPGMRVLDVGCGTGLVALPAAEIVGPKGRVLGVDPSDRMRKVAQRHGKFDTVEGVAEALPVAEAEFDVVTMGYALRHVGDLSAALGEFYRALIPGGRVLIMEITPPKSALGRMVMKPIMGWLVPAISALVSVSADSWRLMRYYWETIDKCIPPSQVVAALEAAGFEDVRRSVELGVFSVYSGVKPTGRLEESRS